MAEVALHVPGLSAAHEGHRLGEALRFLDGVRHARVDLAGKRIIVEYDETTVSVEELSSVLRSGGHAVTSAATPPLTARDPVCGMALDPHTAEHRSAYSGQTYVFCTLICKTTFQAHPAQYVPAGD